MSGRSPVPGSALHRHPRCAPTDHARLPLFGLPSGLFTAQTEAARGLNLAAAIDHQLFSPEALRFIENLTTKFDAHADEIMQKVAQIRDFLLARNRWTVSFTGSDEAFSTLTRTLVNWATHLRNEPIVDVLPVIQPFATPPREGLAGRCRLLREGYAGAASGAPRRAAIQARRVPRQFRLPVAGDTL